MHGLGRSGDSVLIQNNTVIKTCNTNQERFKRSFEKQRAFISPFIQSVPITHHGQTNNQWHITMPRLHCDNSMVWISVAGADQINELTDTIINYFNSIIANSVQQPFDYSMWNSKLHELRSKLDDDLLIVIDWLWSLEFEHHLYYGTIHGDLTLTNLLISEDNGLEINAIDFLDVFIESIILDICKWRQDTAHFWTLNIVENKSNIDMNRVKLLLSYVDNKIEGFINNNAILQEYYLPFQILNLLRIIPYNKEDSRIQAYLKAEVLRLYDDRPKTNTDNTSSR